MIIGIDAREIQEGVHTGMGRALIVFLEYFSRQTDNNTCILFSSKPLQYFTPSLRIQTVVKKENCMWLWDQVTLFQLIKQNTIDIFYSPYYKIPLLCSCPCISAIFDLMYVYCTCYKKQLSLLSRLYLKTFGRLMAHRADAIFTCSEYSKTEIMRFYGVTAEKIKVIYLGLAEIYKPVHDLEKKKKIREKYNINSDYVLYTGNFKQHKNVESLINAFGIVLQAFPGIKLVLSGAQKTSSINIERLIASGEHSRSIIITGNISLEDQAVLYSAAKVFVMPSLYEGFGYPPLEAMACGTPVISSTLTSLDEIVGGAALKIDPHNPKDIADKIIEALKSPELLKSLSKKGMEQAGKFTSMKYAESLYTLILDTGNKSEKNAVT